MSKPQGSVALCSRKAAMCIVRPWRLYDHPKPHPKGFACRVYQGTGRVLVPRHATGTGAAEPAVDPDRYGGTLVYFEGACFFPDYV
jgi:hypothetical protein